MLLNCGVGEDSQESLALQGDQTSQSKGYQPWIFIGRTDTEAEAPILGHLMQRTASLEKTLMLGKFEGRRRRGWGYGWMTSTLWIWVWASSRSWWWTGKHGMLQSMESQRVGQDRVNELNWLEISAVCSMVSNSYIYSCRLIGRGHAVNSECEGESHSDGS